MNWEILGKNNYGKSKVEDIVNVLLRNRGITTKKQREIFFEPKKPEKITLNELGINKTQITKALKRIKKSKEFGEAVVVYGDYDADGVCATAIMWEVLSELGLKVMPHIPDRFEEGYGINSESIDLLISKYPKLKLIIAVDNGIVANKAVTYAKKKGIDVIITDHHQPGKKLPKAYSIIHTDLISGSAVSWVLAREIRKKFKIPNTRFVNGIGLDLVAVGTVADLLPLVGANRSFVSHGLETLKETKRPGLKALFKEARIEKKDIEAYHIGFVVAPRINAMGRMDHAIDSLRLLCTKKKDKAHGYAKILGETNHSRQDTVEEIVTHALKSAKKRQWKGAIVLSHESYHEGVIGLAASKLVEKFYRPAIVISKGKEISKASARSISGFNIIEAIREFDDLVEGGGHPMAAGFSIETDKLGKFMEKFEQFSVELLTDDILTRSLKIDLELQFSQMSFNFIEKLKSFNPTGIGNPTPVFCTNGTRLLDTRTVGRDASHLRLKLENDDIVYDAIGFGMGHLYTKLMTVEEVAVAYNLEKNVWNGRKTIQLKLKDILFV